VQHAEGKAPTIGSVLLIVSIVLCVLMLLCIARPRTSNSYENQVHVTQLCLTCSRTAIDHFTQQTGRFPTSLAELGAHMDGRWAFPKPAEWLSKRRGDFSEHRELDGTGGIYYNPATGKIKVNLTKPVRYYHWAYFGPGRDEIPADW
jgi:hypothetical protein